MTSADIQKGNQIESRPDGFLVAKSIYPDIDGWGMTLMERVEDGELFIKRGKLLLGSKTPYQTEWYEAKRIQEGDTQ